MEQTGRGEKKKKRIDTEKFEEKFMFNLHMQTVAKKILTVLGNSVASNNYIYGGWNIKEMYKHKQGTSLSCCYIYIYLLISLSLSFL